MTNLNMIEANVHLHDYMINIKDCPILIAPAAFIILMTFIYFILKKFFMTFISFLNLL